MKSTVGRRNAYTLPGAIAPLGAVLARVQGSRPAHRQLPSRDWRRAAYGALGIVLAAYVTLGAASLAATSPLSLLGLFVATLGVGLVFRRESK